MKFRRIVELAHLWLGLILGAQVILWMASGVVMSFFDIDLVHGDPNAAPAYPMELETTSYANPGGVIAQWPGASELKLKHFLGQPAYEAHGADGAALFDARSGTLISPLTEDQARAVAKADFVGEGDVDTVELLHEIPIEYRRPGPVWRVTFTDDLATRLYISPETGEVTARRNRIWRLYDFFWMLHIMDYEGRENFNNPLVKTASATALLFSLTGAFLVVTSFMRGRHRIARRRNASAPVQTPAPQAESKSPPEPAGS